MKSTTFALGGLLAASVTAQHAGHQAFHNHHKRDAAPAVEWVTATEYTTEVVDVTTTIWVSEGYVAPTIASVASTTAVGAQFFQPAAVSSSSSTSSSVYVAPTPSSTPSTSIAATSTYVAPVVAAPIATPSSSSTPVAVQSTTSVAPIIAAVATTLQTVASSSTSSAAAASTSSSASSGNTVTGTNTGTIFMFGSDTTARTTLYDSGSCGLSTYFTDVVPASSDVHLVAFPSQVMQNYGSSQNNKLCGKTATLTSGGKTVDVVIADTNVSSEDSIDMTSAVWEFFGHSDGDGSHVGFEIEWTVDM